MAQYRSQYARSSLHLGTRRCLLPEVEALEVAARIVALVALALVALALALEALVLGLGLVARQRPRVVLLRRRAVVLGSIVARARTLTV